MRSFDDLSRELQVLCSTVIQICRDYGIGGNVDTATVLKALAVFARTSEAEQLDRLTDSQQRKARAIIAGFSLHEIYPSDDTALVLETVADEIEVALLEQAFTREKLTEN